LASSEEIVEFVVAVAKSTRDLKHYQTSTSGSDPI
jgi:hypothetical protein